MPNICVSVREGASAIAGGRHATKKDLAIAKTIFDSVGKSVLIEEDLLDAVTGLSGSGPAYIFLIIDALADAGVKMGLSRHDSTILASQTVLGAAKMLIETKEHPGRLKDMVTSPGGTAIAGLHTLEQGGVRTTLINAVEVATQRSKALGEMMKNNLTNLWGESRHGTNQ
jgi:pyrroline-5-carboxylate reductase